MNRYADLPLIFNTEPQIAYAVGSNESWGPYYVGDWQYLYIDIDTSSAAASHLNVDVFWSLQENPQHPFLELHERHSVHVQTPGVPSFTGRGYLCLPIKGIYCRILISSPTGIPVYALSARLSNVQAQGVVQHILNTTTPVTAAGNSYSHYSTMSTVGKARISGYTYNDSAGSRVQIQLYEQSTDGTEQRIWLHLTPPGLIAQTVTPFEFVIPLNGRGLRAFIQHLSGAGIMNAYIIIQPFIYEGN